MFQQPQNNRSAYAHSTTNNRPVTMPQSSAMNGRGMNQMGMNMQGMNMMGSGGAQSQPNQWQQQQQQQQMYGMNQPQMSPQSYYGNNQYQSQMGMGGMQYNGMPGQHQESTYRSH
ncbi:hypothetical protein Trydic_g8264 [Trypoxylus dichotomus]